ncbi:MAG: triose-phosphate isomerase [Burkholderiaceae bacterium]|nr:triose-phosphate isomerase [Burkholderiaceae bacterium]
MRATLIAGNWKMNGSLASNAGLLDDVRAGSGASRAQLAVCVPAPYLAQAQAALTGSAVAWGAQDLSVHDSGAYTGEVSAAMLGDFDCTYVIVGHSERRSYHGESDELVAQKTARALAARLVPIVCVGETLAEREQGATEAVVVRQLKPVLDAVGSDLAKIVVAYEPVWAIGTGKTATPEMAQQVHELIRATLAQRDAAAAQQVQILYGGSMKPDNAKDLLAMPDIDGGLIGGASLKAADFLAIAHAA